MKILFFGSGGFGLAILERLADRGDDVTLVTIPARPKGRGLRVEAGELASAAGRRGLAVISQEDIRDPAFQSGLSALGPEVVLVVDYGKIVPPAIIGLASRLAVNVHPSLLPRYRGASPIQSCLLNGDLETGVTIQVLSERLDAGDILASAATPVAVDDDYPSLAGRLAAMAVPLVESVLDARITGAPVVQDESRAVYCRKFGKEALTVDWTHAAVAIRDRIRAFAPHGLRSEFRDGAFKILGAGVVSREKTWTSEPGRICAVSPEAGVLVSTGRDCLALTEVQPENRKRMRIKDFINGYRPETGEAFRS